MDYKKLICLWDMKKEGVNMSWIQNLYETYNSCQTAIGYSTNNIERPLLPICHITAKAHIEVAIDGEGNFLRARVISNGENDSITIIPCTETSSSRSGKKPEAHPLCDKLQYVAGDFSEYGGEVTSGFASNPSEPYKKYIEILTKWSESKFSHPKATSVLKYVKKSCLVRDLVEEKILLIDGNKKLLKKSEVKDKIDSTNIFSVVNPQDNAFVRWIVEVPGENETRVWRDKTLWKSWSDYYLSIKDKENICFVLGEKAVLTNNHPKYIRCEGDGAKIISSNDSSGFTFRGRFLTDDQACNVSLEVSQKAHNALIWLISRQGKTFYGNGKNTPGLSVVAWAKVDEKIPQPTDDPVDILINDLPNDDSLFTFTAQDYAIKLRNKILGYNAKLEESKNIYVIGLDSASKGRLAITYYKELDSSDYLQKINQWHEDCAWIHRYRIENKKIGSFGNKVSLPFFVGAPSPQDIAEAVYGKNVDGKLKQTTISRILPCIIDGQPIPYDLVETIVRRASNRIALDHWEWERTLSIACSLFRKYNRKEKYSMALELNRTTRDYLYGRLLALAESLERWALDSGHEDRETNAARLMQRFAEHPYSTWKTIELALTPYKIRLGGKSEKRQRMIDEVINSFDYIDFTNDKRLTGEFLLGYHCQREYLHKLSETKKESEDSEK